MTSAEKLAEEWWDKNPTFRGDHTQGMFLSVRDYVDIFLWASGAIPHDHTVTREEAIKLLIPVARKYLDQEDV